MSTGKYILVRSNLVSLLCRLGPRATLLVGVAMHAVGYFTLYLAAHGTITPPYWALILITFLTCNAQTWFETGSMVTSIRNFDTER